MATAGELTIIIEAQDRASAQLRAVGQDVQRLERQVEGLQRATRAGGGLLGGLSVGAGIAAAQQAFGALGGVLDFIRDSVVTLNRELERNVATFEQVTGSAQAAADVVAALRREAAVSPFGDREVLDAGRQLINVSDRSTESLLGLVRVAEQLAALDPAQGLEGAATALREALGGDFQSLAERFEISRQAIARFRAEGRSNLEVVTAALREMGVTSALVERLGRTFEGRTSTVRAFFDELRGRVGAGLFDRLNDLLGKLVALIDEFGDRLRVLATGIGTALGAVAERIGAALVGPLRALSEAFAPGLWDAMAESMAKVPAAIAQTEDAARRAAPAVETVEHQLGRLGVAAAQLSLDADRVRRGYEDQLRPLQRQLDLLQNSIDLQRVQNALASNRALTERLQLTRELQALERAGAGADPNAENLTPRQRAIALAAQERRLRLEELGLQEQQRPVVQDLQQRIAAIQEAQRQALEPLERALTLRKDEIAQLQIVRDQERLLADDVAATARRRMEGWTSQNPGAIDEVKRRGEELAASWLDGWQAWIDANGGSVWAAMAKSLEDWYETTGKPLAVRVGKDIGTAIGDAAATAVGDRLKQLQADVLANPLVAGALGGATAAAGGALPVLPRVAEAVQGVQGLPQTGITVGPITIGGVSDPGLAERLKQALTDFLTAFVLTGMGTEPGAQTPLPGAGR